MQTNPTLWVARENTKNEEEMHNEVTKIPDLQKNMHLDFKVDKFIKMMDFLFFYFFILNKSYENE